MAEVSAAMVKELREKTDAPMMECKRALSEALGDMDKAEEILRVKLGSKASKAAGRITAEGLLGIYLSEDTKLGAMVEVNCETDFVAKNDDFIAFTKALAQLIVLTRPADIVALSSLTLNGQTVEEARKTLIGKIGENVSIRRFVRTEAQGKLATYVHGGSRIAVLIDVVGGDEVLAKDLAMHIAASKPVALSKDQVSPALIQKERAVAQAKAIEAGKPANIAEKMVEGSVQKFLNEVALLGQPFVKDDKQTVEALLKSKGASISSFTLYIVGEGIEKKANDFAAEVAAQAAAAQHANL